MTLDEVILALRAQEVSGLTLNRVVAALEVVKRERTATAVQMRDCVERCSQLERTAADAREERDYIRKVAARLAAVIRAARLSILGGKGKIPGEIEDEMLAALTEFTEATR